MNSILFLPRILWFAFLMSITILPIVLLKTQSTPSGANQATEPLTLVATALFFLSLGLPAIFKKISAKARASMSGSAVAHSPEDKNEQLRKSAAEYFLPLLIELAFAEAISIIGFVVARLSADPKAIYPFIAATLFLFIIKFPTEKKIRAFSGM